MIDKRKILSEFDVDEYLGYFELLGGLVKRNTVTFEDVYDAFGYYIEAAWKNTSIQDYITELRKGSSDIYEQFEYLSGRVIMMSEKQDRLNWIWLFLQY